MLAELESVTEALRQANNHRSELEHETRQLREWAESDRHEVRHTNYPNRANQLLDRAEQRDARAEELEPELADVRQRIATLDQQEQAIRERMLVP